MTTNLYTSYISLTEIKGVKVLQKEALELHDYQSIRVSVLVEILL